MISDFKPTTAPGDDYKVIQFDDSTCIIISVLCEQSQSSRKRRITHIGTHVFSLGRMIFARRESRVRMFF